MKQYNVAILGATGAVGQEMMKILAERDFPVAAAAPAGCPRAPWGRRCSGRGRS